MSKPLTYLLLIPLLALAGCQEGKLTLTPPSSTVPQSTKTSPLPPVYAPDNGDGTYKNPILFADYSDPDVVRVGDDFYLTASSFSCFPGLPILHSKDLVNWTIIGHALDMYPAPFTDFFTTPQHGKGVWAPSFRFHNGEFFIFFGDPDQGLFMTKAKNPAGPWSPLHLVKSAKGWIDCCPFWDDDAGGGKAYLVHAFARSRAGFANALDICAMSPDGTRLLDDGKRIFDGGSDPVSTTSRPAPVAGRYTTVEGPKLYKRKGYYYIFAPGGGVATGYQIAFRSKSIYGPYESRIVLDQGNTPINGPHQGAWIDTPDGAQDWFIHFQDRNAYGRVAHLQPVTWQDNWPIIGQPPPNSPDATKGNPVLTHKKPSVSKSNPPATPQTSDDFNQPTLGLQWQWPANYHPNWASLTARPGYLRLTSVSPAQPTPFYNRPNLLLQKFPAESFTATTRLNLAGLQPGDTAGLLIVGPSAASLTAEKMNTGYKVTRTNFQVTPAAATRPGLPLDSALDSKDFDADTIYLRVKVTPSARGGNADCIFSYSLDNQTYTPLGQPFTAVKDQWIGAKIGLFCNAPPSTTPKGHADFDFFHFE